MENEQAVKPAAASEAATLIPTAPAPKTPSPVPAVPSAAELVAPASDGLDASQPKEALKQAVEIYTDAVFNDLDKALAAVASSLALPKRPPDPSLASELLAGLVGTLTEIALNYFSAGMFDVVKHAVSHKSAESVAKATEQVAIKVGKVVEGKVSKYLEREPEREKEVSEARAQQSSKDESSDPGETHYMNLASKNLLEEFMFRQTQALNWQRASARVFQLSGALSSARPSQLVETARSLQANKNNEDRIGNFQKQIALGWMNFCTRASVEHDLVQGVSVANAMQATPLDQRGEWKHAEGAIDVLIRVPRTIYGVAGLEIEHMMADTGPGTVGILQKSNGLLMNAPVLRRISLQVGDGALQSQCAIVLFPNGGMNVDVRNTVLVAIGTSAASDRDEQRSESAVLAQVGAQRLLSWLQPVRLGTLR